LQHHPILSMQVSRPCILEQSDMKDDPIVSRIRLMAMCQPIGRRTVDFHIAMPRHTADSNMRMRKIGSRITIQRAGVDHFNRLARGSLKGLSAKIEPLPEVGVGVALPVLGHGVDQVFAVAVDGHVGAGRGGLQALDRRRDLHSVIGRLGLAAGEGQAGPRTLDDDAPPAGAGVARA
jgi:hypothetical protein